MNSFFFQLSIRILFLLLFVAQILSEICNEENGDGWRGAPFWLLVAGAIDPRKYAPAQQRAKQRPKKKKKNRLRYVRQYRGK